MQRAPLKPAVSVALILTLLGGAATGCAANAPTPYAPMSDQGGYAEREIAPGIYVARFSGNPFTRARDAELFSRFRAVEACSERGFRLTEILEPSEAGASGRDVFGAVWKWDQKLKLPIFVTYFRCSNEAYQAKVTLKAVSGRSAGLRVTGVPEASPNHGNFRAGDLLLKVNGERVATTARFLAALEEAPDPKAIEFVILRRGKRMKRKGVATDATAELEASERELLNAACAVPALKLRPLCVFRIPAVDESRVEDHGTHP